MSPEPCPETSNVILIYFRIRVNEFRIYEFRVFYAFLFCEMLKQVSRTFISLVKQEGVVMGEWKKRMTCRKFLKTTAAGDRPGHRW